MRCPTCKQLVAEGAGFRPFCSKRCKMIDLGKWLDGSYAIPDEALPADSDDGIDDLDVLDEPPPRRR